MIVSILQRTRDRSWLPRAAFALLLTLRGTADHQHRGPAAPATTPGVAVKVHGHQHVPPRGRPMAASALAHRREIRVPGLSSDYPLVHCNGRRGVPDDHRHGPCQRRRIDDGGALQRPVRSAPDLFSDRRYRRHRSRIAAPSARPHGRAMSSTSVSRTRSTRVSCRATGTTAISVLDTDAPGKKPQLDYRTEVFRLDEALLQRPLSLSHQVTLEDSDDVRAYRAHYPRRAGQPAAAGDPVRYGHQRHLVDRRSAWASMRVAGPHCSPMGRASTARRSRRTTPRSLR